MIHNTSLASDSHMSNDASRSHPAAYPSTFPEPQMAPPVPAFDPEIIPQLPQMSVQQLNNLEVQIHKEFTELAHEYISARLSRLNYIIEKLDSNIEGSRACDSRWTQFYNSQIQAIEDLNHITENSILAGSRASSKQVPDFSDEFERKISSLISAVESPLEYDIFFEGSNDALPFSAYLSEIIDHHKEELNASLNLKKYHAQYVDSITDKNKMLAWKSCKLDIMEHKEYLIRKTESELQSLTDNYHSVTPSISLSASDKQYYRSAVPVVDMKGPGPGSQSRLEVGNIDSYYDIDNVYYKKNQLEISDTKRDVLAREQQFRDANNSHSIPQLESVVIKLDGCTGLSAKESESDLARIRAYKTAHNHSKACDKVREAQVSSEPNTPTEESPDNSNDRDYKQLLNLNRTASNIKLETFE